MTKRTQLERLQCTIQVLIELLGETPDFDDQAKIAYTIHKLLQKRRGLL